MKDCPLCHGDRIIRLRVSEPSLATAVAPIAFEPPAPSSTLKTYPCPECGPSAPSERVAFVRYGYDQVMELETDEHYVEHMRKGAALAIGRAILESGHIRFEEVPGDRDENDMGRPRPVRRMRATAGVVAQGHVATMEERIAERQDEVAREVAREAQRRIRVWAAHYSGDEGNISKGQAAQAVAEALQAVLAGYRRQD